MHDDELSLVTAVLADNTDHASRLVYADWLEEHGDPRANYLRLELEFATHEPWHCFQCSTHEEIASFAAYERCFEQLQATSLSLDPEWIEAIALPMDIVLYDFNGQKIPAIKIARQIVNMGLLDCKLLVEDCPTCFAFGLSFPVAAKLMVDAWREAASSSRYGDYEAVRLGVQRSGETPFCFTTESPVRRYGTQPLPNLRRFVPQATPMNLYVLGGFREIGEIGTIGTIDRCEAVVRDLGLPTFEPTGRPPFPALVAEVLEPQEQAYWVESINDFLTTYDGRLYLAFQPIV